MKLAIIGDVHLKWNECDVDFFNQSDYDLILFVGDVANYSFSSSIRCYKLISTLKKKTLFLPGNHDAVNAFQLLGEITGQSWLKKTFAFEQDRLVEKLQEILRPVELAGYSLHDFRIKGEQLSVVACRPHSMGGPNFSFLPYLEKRFMVSNFDQSGVFLQCLVERAKSDRIIFLAHNGPTGLGSNKDDIWGCDFNEKIGDFGDRDLNMAIEYAKSIGKEVLLVAAGHMHHNVKGEKKERVWKKTIEGITYVNAAKVPRIKKQGKINYHHHVSIELKKQIVMAEEKWIGFEPV